MHAYRRDTAEAVEAYTTNIVQIGQTVRKLEEMRIQEIAFFILIII